MKTRSPFAFLLIVFLCAWGPWSGGGSSGSPVGSSYQSGTTPSKISPATAWTVTGNMTLVAISDSHNVGLMGAMWNNVPSMGATALQSGSLGQTSLWYVQGAFRQTTNYNSSSYPELGVTVSTGTTTGDTAYASALYQSAGTFGIHGVEFHPGGTRIAGAWNEQSSGNLMSVINNPGGPIYLRLVNDGIGLHMQTSVDGTSYTDNYVLASPSGLGYYGWFQGNEFSSGNGYVRAIVTELNYGIPASCSVSGATNATPIVITCSGNTFLDGDYVTCNGIGGNTAANNATPSNTDFWSGAWGIHVLTSGSTFQLYSQIGATPNWSALAGNGAYTSGGNCVLISR